MRVTQSAVAFLAGGASIAACSFTTNFDGLTGGSSTNGNDASIVDANLDALASSSDAAKDATRDREGAIDAASLLDAPPSSDAADAGPDAGGDTGTDAGATSDASSSCTSKTAIVAGQDQYLFLAARSGTGAWNLSTYPYAPNMSYYSVEVQPAIIGNSDGKFIAVTYSRDGYTYSFASAPELAWNPSNNSGYFGGSSPAALSIADTLYALFVSGNHNLYAYGFTESFNGGAAGFGNAVGGGFGGPTDAYARPGFAALADGSLFAAYRPSTGTGLAIQGFAPRSTSWGSAAVVSGTTVGSSGVTLVAPTGGPSGSPDLIALYCVGTTNKAIKSVQRVNGTWSAETTVGSAGVIDEPPSVATLSNGGLVLVARASSGGGLWASYDPNAMTWSALASLGLSAPVGPVTVAAGVCGDDAVAAWPVNAANVQVSHLNLTTRTWSQDEEVQGTSNAIFAAIATLP